MKIFIQSIYPAPYRVGVFNLLNKETNLFVAFERSQGHQRDKEWFDKNIKFNCVILDNKIDNSKYKKELRKIKDYDYVIAYDYSSLKSMLLMLRCILNKKPYLINCDGAIVKSNFIKDFIKSFFIKRAVAYFANGKSAEQYFLRYGAKKEKIYLHNFSSLYNKDIRSEIVSREEKEKLRRELNLPYERLYVSVGSFIYRKGYDLLIETINKYKLDNCGFVIIGGGEEKENYEKLLKEYNITNIHFIDFLKKEELFEHFKFSDVFIFPTREDIWGLVINEAIAYGLPIISTKQCLASLELLDEKNLYDCNDLERMSSLIKEYTSYTNKKLETLSKEMLEKAKKYTIENMAKEHKKIFERNLKNDEK